MPQSSSCSSRSFVIVWTQLIASSLQYWRLIPSPTKTSLKIAGRPGQRKPVHFGASETALLYEILGLRVSSSRKSRLLQWPRSSATPG